MKEQKKAHARDAYREYAEKHFGVPFGKLNDKQRTEALTRFWVFEIYNRLNTGISEDDFESGWVDAGGDLGVDFIHRDDQAVLLVQSKYASQGSRVDLKDIQHFQTVFDRLKDQKYRRNGRLADALSDIDLEHDRFVMRFIALAEIVGQARVQADAQVDFGGGDLGDRVDLQFSGEPELTDDLRNARSLAQGIPGDFEFVAAGKRGKRSPVIELTEAGYPSCAFVVEATQLEALYRRYRDMLFTLNIRNYLGNTATNKVIAATLRDEPQNFYYYNNGIACLAEKLTVVDDRVQTRGLQVINGAQTIRSLAKAARGAGKDTLAQVRVLVRVTEAATQYGAEGRFRSEIVRFNNTQNVIKLSDFRSNDPIQQDLKKRFGNYRRASRQVHYVPKRTDISRFRGDEVVPLEEFAKVVYAFLRDPISFSAKTSFLFDDGEKGGYRWVFGDGQDVWVSMPESEFKLRSSVWWLSQAFSERLRSDKAKVKDAHELAALERRWMLLFVARLVLERSYSGPGYREELARGFKGDWTFGSGGFGKWMADLYQISRESLVYRYKEAAMRPGFIHRNWMRDPETVRALETYISTAPIRIARRTTVDSDS